MNDTATQTGAARVEPPTLDPDVKTGEEVEVRLNPREIQLAAMADRQEELRQDEISEAVANDPGLAANQVRINNAIAVANAEAGITHEPDETPSFGPAGSEDGAASRQPMHKETPVPRPDLPSNLQDDPLADFIEMVDGNAMVKAKVNGTDRLVPLADAKRQVQIGLSAEIRMQNASEAERILDDRARKLTAGEAALSARMKTVQPQVPVTPAPLQAGLSDEDLLSEATDIFNTAFSGTEEDAAKKLAGTLVKIRNSAVATPTPVDTTAIAQEAATIATGALTSQSRKKDVQKGFVDFKKDYPEIVSDPQLFKMADDMAATIDKENPDWDIAEVMDEAGKRTRAWVKSLSGQSEDTGDNDPAPAPGDPNTSVPDETTQTRQERKAQLVRMPAAAAAAIHSEPEEPDEGSQTPQEAFLQLKKARGQPV